MHSSNIGGAFCTYLPWHAAVPQEGSTMQRYLTSRTRIAFATRPSFYNVTQAEIREGQPGTAGGGQVPEPAQGMLCYAMLCYGWETVAHSVLVRPARTVFSLMRGVTHVSFFSCLARPTTS